MKISPMRCFVAAQTAAIVGVCVAQLPSAQVPNAQVQEPAPKKAPAASVPGRDYESRTFVRDFESSVSGVDLGRELKITAEQGDKLHVILGRLRQSPEVADAQPSPYEQAKKDILAVLTAEQQTRLEQVKFQSRMRSSGMFRAITGNSTIAKLNLTPEQIEKLKAAEAAAQKEYESEMETLRKLQREQQQTVLNTARDRVLSVLTPEQRAQFEKLKGPAVEVNDRGLDYGVAGVQARGGFGSSRGGPFGSRGGFTVPGDAAAPAKPPETKP